jgi:hypothetical protein
MILISLVAFVVILDEAMPDFFVEQFALFRL